MTEQPTRPQRNHDRFQGDSTPDPMDELTHNQKSFIQFCQKLLNAATIEEVLDIYCHAIDGDARVGVTILFSDGLPKVHVLEVAITRVQSGVTAFPKDMQFRAHEPFFEPLWNDRNSIVIKDLVTTPLIGEQLRSDLVRSARNSIAIIPLFSQNQLFGAFLLDRADGNTFTKKDIRIHEALASLARGAVEKLWQSQVQEQEYRRTASLYNISRNLLAAHDVHQILQTVVESKLFGAAGGTIALLVPSWSASDSAELELAFYAAIGAGAQRIQGLRMPVTEGVIGWVVRENKPALVPDAYADDRFYPQVDQEIDFRTRSILSVPLRVEEHVIGAIELVDVQPEALSQEGIELLSQVADQVALLIENQQLLDETRRQAQDLSLLLDVSHDLTSTLEMDQTLLRISSRALNLVKADSCHIFLLQTESNGNVRIKPVFSNDTYAEQILDTSLELGQGITGRVVQSGVGIIANRVDLDPQGFAVPGTPNEPESLIAVPLIAEGDTLGAMTISRRGEEVFLVSDLKRVSALASQAAAVLEKARLFREVQDHSQRLAALNAVISTASQSLSLDEILNATLERVSTVFRDQCLFIALRSPVTGELWLADSHGMPDDLFMHLRMVRLDGSLCAAPANQGQTFTVADLSRDYVEPGDGDGLIIKYLLQAGMCAYLGVPLIAQGEMLGTLNALSPQPDVFTSAEIDFLNTVGQQVGIAIRNAQSFEQIERALEESTALYRASEAISNTLELDDVLKIVVGHLTEYVGVDQCRVVLFDKALGASRVMAEYVATPDAREAWIPIKGNLIYEILNDRGEAVYIEDVNTHPITQQNAHPWIAEGAKSVLLIPLIVQARLIGAVELDATLNHRSFSPSERSFCRALADRAALAIENRQLFSQTYYTLQETTLLYQASRALTRAQDLKDVLNAITDHLAVKRIDQCLLALLDAESANLDSDQRTVRIRALWDHSGDTSLLDQRFSSREFAFIAQNGALEPWVINDVEQESRLGPENIASLRSLGAKSALIVPLVIGETPLGWLMLLTRRDTRIFSPDQIRPFQALADQAAVVIHNQQLLHRVQESLDEVETIHRQYLRDEWSQFLQAKHRNVSAMTYDRGKLQPLPDIVHPLIEEAVIKGAPVTHTIQGQANRDSTALVTRDQPSPRSHENTDGLPSGASVVAPLTVRGQVIGALGIEDPDNDHEWTTDELELVQEIADRVAQAVENARLLEETQSSLAETERLYTATSRLANAESAREVVHILAEELHKTLDPVHSGMILCTGPNPTDRIEWLEINAKWNSTGIELLQDARLSINDYAGLNWLLEQSEPVLIPNAQTPETNGLPRQVLAESRFESVCAIPLTAADRRLGLIHVFNPNGTILDQRTLRFLTSLSDRAAVALDSVRLYRETQKRALQLEAAAKVSRAATSILEQDKLLSSLVKLIGDHFEYYHAQVFLVDPSQRWAVLEASTGEIGQKLLKRGHALEIGGSSLIGYVTETGEPRIASDVSTDPVFFKNPDLPDTHSELAIPLQIGGRVIGALDVQSTQPDAFGSEEIVVLSTLADQLSIAIENARLYQVQLETAQKLREVDRLKTQFMANMSHELRTPLNSIIGFSRVILKGIDGPISELQKQDLTAIYNSGQLLLRLINDILDLSKIEAGKMELAFAETDLEDIIQGVIATTKALVKDKPEVELREKIPERLPTIVADPTRLRQVLLNLLSNATKFTEKGSIELTAYQSAGFVTIKVADSGVGIPSDKFDVIFEEFEQVDGSSTRAVGGTGLGLPISRHLVEMHGGRLWVESRVGVGSIFTVELPIRGPHAVESLDGAAPPGSARRVILAIDDNAQVIDLYKRYLEKMDYQIIGLTEGGLAINTARELRPFAILLDLMLPDRDGWTIVQELRSDPETQDIPIIVCSVTSAMGRGFSLGAADFLLKPINQSQLLAALSRLEKDTTDQTKQTQRVLIVDDTPQDRKLLRRVLESAPESYQILEAEDGLAGLEIIHKMPPDLVILDLMMPQMDGFAVIEALKTNAHTRRIPIIIVTAKDLSERDRNQINGQVAALFHKGLYEEEELLLDLSHALHSVQRVDQSEK